MLKEIVQGQRSETDKKALNSPRVVDLLLDYFVGALEKKRLVGTHLVKNDLLDRALARSSEAEEENLRFRYHAIRIVRKVLFLLIKA